MNPDRDEKGRMLAGNKIARRRIDVVALCREHAAAEGVPFEKLLWNVVKSVTRAAVNGDLAAARMLFDYCFEAPASLERAAPSTQVAVQVNSSQGPPLPPRVSLAAWVDELAEASKALRTADAEAEDILT